ncbi:proteasome subunit alpha [Nitrosopumilus sp. b1]|uniref:archaeal proteasome endopeptidase complex subunit alpha n=1 Tax=Nitrosopumilus sp. b1 TaxID=2109907 RepID=UPI000E2BAAB0|nr:archaeal proteasome endopeptidase complex subunit alpha [Nitrosopumilus sp. b1]RDJ31062.1 MAG: proteasome subunit alpha [Thermoproteota archaeon]KAF6242763.1 proteasome subunit alpha [Nitrosopumilus sp. b1]RDJ34122.1 MAG: proteasome subunit alpha [Thermoproteota archaeon]RDJ36762.1 MAG: proteasome subunit alpha [Thermoproteota archaeon]RDJ37704.1 MAG: proteasome subunit alpha [Thermoproteota archaeon]
MLPAQQGYDRAITVFSPDGRLYQVEYAIETVRRGTIAVGVKSKEGIVIAVEEKPRKLQISENAQKIFQIDEHVGVAAAGYIPDARSQVDNARFFSQSNKLIYDEPVDVETIAKHLADQCQQFTQYAGVRPFGVALILGGVDSEGQSQLYLTDPSGTYISYDAVAIGSNSDQVTDFLEKTFKPEISLDEASALATAGIYLASDDKEGTDHIRMAHIKTATKQFEIVSAQQIATYAKTAKEKYPANS